MTKEQIKKVMTEEHKVICDTEVQIAERETAIKGYELAIKSEELKIAALRQRRAVIWRHIEDINDLEPDKEAPKKKAKVKHAGK